MYEFSYHKAESIEDAVKLLGQSDDAKLLAGGMTLLPTMKQRLAAPDSLIDLAGLSAIDGIKKQDNNIVVGAMSCHASVERSALVKNHIPALAALAGMIGDPQVRNRGTLGGSVANADPASDYPAALVGLGATINTSQRSINADDFFIDLFETELEEHEIISSVSFPIPEQSAYQKFPDPASRYPVVGVFIATFNAGKEVRVAVTGAAGSVFRVDEMERLLADELSIAAIENVTVDADDFNEDIHASAEYRAHLICIMAKRALQQML